MLKKFFVFALTIIVLSFLSQAQVSAKKLLPRAKTPVSRGTKTVQSGPGVSVRFRPDRLAVVASFSGLNQASSVSYMFSYNTRGTTQGAQGSVNTGENNTSREIIFGTCSHGTCRYDYGISNAKLTVTIKFNNGKKLIKTFKLKV